LLLLGDDMTLRADAHSNLWRRLKVRARPKVVVFRALKLGDLLVAVPAFRAVRAALPNAEVTLVGLPWAREFVARYPSYLDAFREFPGHPGLPEREPEPEHLPDFLARMQAARFDLAIQLHGSGPIVNPLVLQFRARHTAGFYLPGDPCPDPDWFLPWPDAGLELRRLLRLTDFIGAPARGEHLEFPLRDEDERAARAALPPRPGPYVCVHPGASVPERRWPAERFAAAADALADRGLAVVLTGTAAEAGLMREVAEQMAAPAIDIAGRTDLGATAAVLRRARLLVCNDTGVSHLAAAIRTPSIVISTGDNPARWSPTDKVRHRVLCRPGGVAVGEVLAAAQDLLARFRPVPTEVMACADSAY
jgi:ADP-heptose:LPS heptosyltransferase